jgi:hypothetical protein
VLHQHEYIRGKLREAEATRRQPLASTDLDRQRPPHRRGIVGPVARVAGRYVRRVGEAVESWGTPQTAA